VKPTVCDGHCVVPVGAVGERVVIRVLEWKILCSS
jgi:hypothetical protein